MVHGRTYIPLSLLTTSSLNKICNNDGLHLIKVPYSVMKQTLYPVHFSDEDDLSIHEWWQVYRNWLSLIDVIANAHVMVGWYEHHDKMQANEAFLHSAKAWQEYDNHLHSHLIAKPFILDPKSMVYSQGLMRAQTNATIAAMVSSHNAHSPWGVLANDDHYSHHGDCHCLPHSPDVHYQPYDSEHHQGSFRNTCPHNALDILCVRCSHTGHKVSECKSDNSSMANRPIIIKWHNKCLVIIKT